MNLTRDGLKDPVWDPDSCPPLTGSPAAPAEAQPSAAIAVSPGQQQLEHMFQLARLHQTLLFCCRLLGTDQQQAGWKGRLVISVLAPKGPPLSPCLAYGSGGKGAHIHHDTAMSQGQVMLILQARLQQYVNHEFPDVQAGFRKGRGTRDQIASIPWIIKKSKRVPEKHLLLFY